MATRPSTIPASESTSTATPNLEGKLLEATKAFYRALDDAYKTLDTRPLRQAQPAQCEACRRYIDAIEATKTDGNHYVDVGRYVVKDVHVVSDGGDRTAASATYDLTYTGFKEVTANGQVVCDVSSQTWRTQALFQRDGDRWVMVEELDLE